LGGELYRGADRSHPESGSSLVEPRGPCLLWLGDAGKRWETGPEMGMVKSQERQTANCKVQAPKRFPAAKGRRRTGAGAGRREAVYLGLVWHLTTLFVPDRICVGGRVMRA